MELNNKTESPVIFLETIVVFPRMTLSLVLKKPESVLALEEVMHKDGLVVFSLQGKRIGTLARVSQALQAQDGSIKIMVEGLARAEIKNLIQDKPYLRAKISLFERYPDDGVQVKALIRSVIDQLKECINLGKIIPADLLVAILNINDAAQLADVLAINLDLKNQERQEILELIDPQKRLQRISEFLVREAEILKTGKKLKKDISKKLQKMSKEAYLREQLKSIEKELGVGSQRSEITEYKERVKKSKCPKRIKKVIQKEVDRLRRMPSFSPEGSYVRTYLDWLLDLPWQAKKGKDIDLKKAQAVLDRDHSGLEKVKERIIEYLAVQKKVGKIKGPILCFVGPPGTGKTSIGQSVAKALGRKFIRISLGGVRDEAEIRGHRRTYVGALPGRIIQGIKNAGTSNPVFMLDEIDKLGNDFRGDPSSALLEALDPEQNSEFSDHYLEVPYDLSDVMFITTANVLGTIPPALRDRLEVIRFSGFTPEEKFCISKKHLLPKLLESHGLSVNKELIITDSALKKIISFYTYEAGVRNLEREIAKLCRKTARLEKQVKVNKDNLDKYLGPAKFSPNQTNGQDEVGVVTGLAWTEAGGETLSIEAVKMPGKGGLSLTGSLGRVMQESARAAYSFAKSRANHPMLKEDVHLHVPSGAIPKDGPSAGIAMATVLVSVLENKKIRHDIAMTGEVTLRGKILEVGGIKEKVLAAYRAKLKTIILPFDNKKNLIDVPKEIKKKLKFVLVKDMKQVLKQALI